MPPSYTVTHRNLPADAAERVSAAAARLLAEQSDSPEARDPEAAMEVADYDSNPAR